MESSKSLYTKTTGAKSTEVTYKCGGCDFMSPDIYALHLHLQDHPEGGSYYYNSNLRIAFPKYDTTCSAVQTDNLANVKLEPITPVAYNGRLTSSNNTKENANNIVISRDFYSEHATFHDVDKANINKVVQTSEHDVGRTFTVIQRNDNEYQHFANDGNTENAMIDDKDMYNVVKIEHHDSFDGETVSDDDQTIISNDSNSTISYSDHFNETKECDKDSGKHVKNKNDEIKLNCKFCNKTYSYSANLKKHIAEFHSDEKIWGDRPYTCHICSKGFSKNGYLKDHLKLHVGKITKICQHCGEGFLNNDKYHSHLKKCQKRLSCEICGTKYGTRHDLMKHMCVHTGDKPYMCQSCGFRTAHASLLITHTRYKHTNERNYKCEKCDKAFVTGRDLKHHDMVHSKIRPHVCEVCNKQFSRLWSLKSHMRQHTGDKPYKCTNCGIGFAQNVSRRTHQSKCLVTAEGFQGDIPPVDIIDS